MIDRTGCDAKRHGTASAYAAAGCRCPDALAAKNRLNKKHRLRVVEGTTSAFVNSTGTLRRLDALACMGWPAETISALTGINETTFSLIRRRPGRRVTPANAARVARVYRDLSEKHGPSTSAAKRATARGALPPIAWDDIDNPDAKPYAEMQVEVDEVAVQRAVDGRMSARDLTIGEREAAVRLIHRQGLTDGHAAERLGLAGETVMRIRKRLCLPANATSGHEKAAG